jgi:CBS domain-containing protein
MQFRVKDIMSKEMKYVMPEMNAREALKLLLDNDMSGLPVLDGAGNLVGVFTEREILKTILPVYLKDVGSFVYAEEPKSGIRKLASIDRFLVRDLMRKDFSTIDAESSLMEASRMMLTRSERRLVVISGGKPAGVITRCDVVRALGKEAGIL